MAQDIYGFFAYSEREAHFLTAVTIDPEKLTTFKSMRQVLESHGPFPPTSRGLGSEYIIFADATTMQEDEAEDEQFFYSITPKELAKQEAPVLAGDEVAIFRVLLKRIFEGALEALTPSRETAALAAYFSAIKDAAEQAQAAETIAADTLVYLSCACGVGHRAAHPERFNPRYHDARRVLLANDLPQLAKTKLLIQQLPPHLRKQNGGYWASLRLDKATPTFMGDTKAELLKKAAIHLAWVEKFGPHAKC
jgi:hypothetical protein